MQNGSNAAPQVADYTAMLGFVRWSSGRITAQASDPRQRRQGQTGRVHRAQRAGMGRIAVQPPHNIQQNNHMSAPCQLGGVSSAGSRFPSISALLRHQAAHAARAPALLAVAGDVLDYDTVLRRVSALIAALIGEGVAPGQRVAIVLPNGTDMALAALGVASYTACAPLNPAYQTADFEFYLGDLDARALLTTVGFDTPARRVAAAHGIPVIELGGEPTWAPGVSSVAASLTAAESGGEYGAGIDDVALVLHTSGTTSRPKLVPLTHRNLCASAANVATALALGPGDRCLNVMPLFHIHGLVAALLASLHCGASVVCAPGLAMSEFAGWLQRFRPTWYTAVPTMHQAILDAASAHPDGYARASSAFHPFLLRSPAASGHEGARGGVLSAGDRSLRDDGGGASDDQQSAAAGAAQAGFGRHRGGPGGRHHGCQAPTAGAGRKPGRW